MRDGLISKNALQYLQYTQRIIHHVVRIYFFRDYLVPYLLEHCHIA